jgi:nicotinamidase-related amidase
MPAKNEDLHGNVPDKSSVALLLIDVINDLEFEGGKDLLPHAIEMARNIAALKRRAKQRGIPVVYVNDNFGKWQSDFNSVLDHCLEDGVCGKPVAESLRPDADDYFVLKPKHSGFQFSALHLLLEHLGARTLILTGVAGNFCVLFTAHDAYMRDYRLVVPRDCVASLAPRDDRYALAHMAEVTKADVRPAARIDLSAL